MEALGFHGLTSEDQVRLRELISEVTVIGIDHDIKEKVIELRQTTSLRLPDAIIVATAMLADAELLTHDVNLLKIPGLKASAPQLKS